VKTVAIAGSVAQRPAIGGHTWVFLQYLLGFRRLGFDVLFIDRLEPSMCADASGRPCPLAESFNWKYFRSVMDRFELGGSFSLLSNGEAFAGLSKPQLLDRVENAEFLLNVMGYLEDEEILGRARRRVFLDIDPGFTQMWQDLGLARLLQDHDRYVTIALNLGRGECSIPDCGIEWIRTPQPVVLDLWPPCPPAPESSWTSVITWRGPYASLQHGGRRYGLRLHEFRKFITLPSASGERFLLALDIHPDEVGDLRLLSENGWRLTDPREAAGDPDRYQSFIQGSRAEFMVAKSIYVESRSGWLSDRSICYLASGRPVLAQDSGLEGHFPTTCGLLTFSTFEEVLNRIDELNRDYSKQAAAARELAQEFFDSDRVLSRLLDRLDVN
jgi:hypothetical protein